MFCCVVLLSIFTSCAVFWRACGATTSKIPNDTTQQNVQEEIYYSTRQIVMSGGVNSVDIYLQGKLDRSMYAKWNGIRAGNPANWLVNSRRTRETGFCAVFPFVEEDIILPFFLGGGAFVGFMGLRAAAI